MDIHFHMSNRFIYTPLFKSPLGSDQVIFLDGGARGNLPPEWSLLESLGCLKTIGFEPDIEECDRLNSSAPINPSRTYFPKALWSTDGQINIHIARSPGSSSVYPPNQEVLRKFDQGVWEPRCTDKYITVESVTIDSILKMADSDCDFIKLDIHSAEYEALKGATSSLKTKVFGILVETWTLEYHQGQYLAHDVMKALIDLGFQLFEVGIAAGGYRAITKTVPLYGKQQVHGLNLLFFKDPIVFPCDQKSLVKCVKSAAIVDLYGYPDYAMSILKDQADRCPEQAPVLQQVAQAIISSSQVPHNDFATLH
jgi:FkbM family methyltransferase